MNIHRESVIAREQGDSSMATGRARDERAADQIRAHHAVMVAHLDRLTAALRDGRPAEQERARGELIKWIETVLLPHAAEEEETTYRAAADLSEGRLLIEAMVREHGVIKRLVALLRASEGAVAAMAGRAIYEAFTAHQGTENEVILPLLVGGAGVSLAEVVGLQHGDGVGEREHAHG